MLPQVKFTITFIQKHAQQCGISHSAPLRVRSSDPPVFLPASQNYKTVHQQYVASCGEANIRSMGISSFRSVWQQCLPSIKFMTPCTDAYDLCEHFRRQVTSDRRAEGSCSSGLFKSPAACTSRKRQLPTVHNSCCR